MKNFLIRFFRQGARLLFGLTILLAPFRQRIVVLPRPFFPVYSDYTDILFFTSDAAMILTLVFWGCSHIVEPRRLEAGNPFLLMMTAGLTIAAWISSLGSFDPILSRHHALRFVILLFFYLYIVNEIASPGWALIPAALQGLIQAPLAIGQSFAQSSLGLGWLGEHVLNPLAPGTSIIPVAGERFLRAYGLADHPNILGGSLAFALVLLAAAVLYGKRRQPLLASSVFLILFPAFLLTFSRSAWVSLFAALSFLVLCEALAHRWDSLKRLILLGMLSLAVSYPLLVNHLSVFDQRFNSGNIAQDGPMFERAFLLEAGNTLFMEHPAIGIGLGAAPLAMMLRFDYFPLNYQPPHFTPLLAALETGVIGGGFYLLLFLYPFFAFLLGWRQSLRRPILLGVFALLFAVNVVNLFDYYTWTYAPGRIWQWLAWGLVSAAIKEIV